MTIIKFRSFSSLPQNPTPVTILPQVLPIALVLPPQLLSVPADLPSLDISYQWNRTTRGLSRLASFTWHNVFKVQVRWVFFSPSQDAIWFLHWMAFFLASYKHSAERPFQIMLISCSSSKFPPRFNLMAVDQTNLY